MTRMIYAVLLLVGFLTLHNFGVVAQPIVGAGATFPAPIYAKWFDGFRLEHPDVAFNYDRVGSEEGIRRFLAGELDFAASDWPLTDGQTAQVPGGVLQLPPLLGAVVPTYNLTGISDTLRFAPAVLSGIFRGKIRRWDHPLIQADNVGVKLPHEKIIVVHRLDGSGTNYVFTEYLASIGAGWRRGTGFTVPWPRRSIGARGNDGVAQAVRTTEGAIGYVEYYYAIQSHLDYGYVKNKMGRFIRADVESISASIPDPRHLPVSPGELAMSVLNSGNAGAYPISSLTWLIVPLRASDRNMNGTIQEFLNWILTSGQLVSSGMGYARLPRDLVTRELAELNKLER